jgi:hypothetical protein
MNDTQENVQKLIAEGHLDEALAMTNRLESGNAITENEEVSSDKPSGDEINEINGNTEGVKDESISSENTESSNDSAENNQQEDNKSFLDVTYGGQHIQLDNHDGYLGYGDRSGAVKALAHNKLHLKKVESDFNAKAEENRLLQERIRELEQKSNQQISPIDQAANPPVDTNVDINIDFEALKNLAVVDGDEDDESNYGSFTKSLESTLKGLSSKIDNLSAENKKKDDIINNLKELSDKNVASAEEQAYWNSTENFRGKYGFNTSDRKLSEIEGEVFSWKNEVANIYGIDRKNQYGASQLDNILSQWKNGDQNVREALKGTNIPTGAEDYINIFEIESEKKSLQDSGILGPNATYEAVMRNRNVAPQQSINHSSSHKGDDKGTLHKSVTTGATKEQILEANADINENYATTYQGSEKAVIPEDNAEEHGKMMLELASIFNGDPDTDVAELAKNPRYAEFLKKNFPNQI